MYVDELVAPNTVTSVPEATPQATEAGGEIRGNAIAGTYEQGRAELDAVEKLGISYDEVVQLLADEGVEKFEASWNDLLKSTEAELQRLAPWMIADPGTQELDDLWLEGTCCSCQSPPPK